MAKRRAIELDAGASEITREDVILLGLRMATSGTGSADGIKVNYYETEYRYSSCRIGHYGDSVVSVDRAADGLYRLKITRKSPKEIFTTNYVDWPELGELFELLYRHCA